MQQRFTEFDDAAKKGSTISYSLAKAIYLKLFYTGGKLAPSRDDVIPFMEVFKKLIVALIELGHLNMKLDQTGIL